MRKDKVKVIGKTTDGTLVVQGVFKFFESEGIPLHVIFELCKENNWVPSWLHIYKDGKQSGWTHKTILDRLREGMQDVYETDFINTVIKRLDKLHI